MSVHTIPYDSGLVALVGDLHYDNHDRAGLDPIESGGLSGLPWTRLDALIVTGDLANSPCVSWRPALRRLSRWIDPSRIYVLPGNHDYYGFGIDGDGDLRRHAAAEGMHFLQKTELIHGATRFLCVTLWTDFDLLGDPATAMREAGRRMNDYSRISMPDPQQATLLQEFQASRRRVSLTPEVVLKLHHNHRRWLEDRLIMLRDNHLGRCRQPPWPVGLNGRRACPSGGQPHRLD
ncbi:metallophosphoesterase [Paracoccaceae bacterium Fryx2]|nr:metallophosphoesterase [Paracoccaceae bacterium Fryx2]